MCTNSRDQKLHYWLVLFQTPMTALTCESFLMLWELALIGRSRSISSYHAAEAHQWHCVCDANSQTCNPIYHQHGRASISHRMNDCPCDSTDMQCPSWVKVTLWLLAHPSPWTFTFGMLCIELYINIIFVCFLAILARGILDYVTLGQDWHRPTPLPKHSDWHMRTHSRTGSLLSQVL